MSKLDVKYSCEMNPDKKIDFRSALYVTKDGVSDLSETDALTGSYTAEGVDGVAITSDVPDFNAVIVDGADYAIRNSKIDLITHADGSEVCDFIGLGSAVAVYNDSHVEIENCEISTEGVAKCAVFVDNGADVVVKDSKLSIMGGKLYDGYVNSADFNSMVAPPWVLGITGNARGTNLMGDKATTVFVNCDVKARNWGVLSTDNGSGNILGVIDTDLTLVGDPEAEKGNPYYKTYGSGYGTYILGCDEEFCGVKMNVGTYIGIAREGNAVYRSSKGPVRIVSAKGEVLYEGEGKGRISELNSDCFGIMAHDRSDLTLTEGTIMNTEHAAFLMRCGGINIDIKDGSQINVKDGVLLQIIDDDDSTVGVDWSSPIMLHFFTEFNEKAGWPSENGQISSMMPPPEKPPMPPMEGMEDMEMPEPRFDVNFKASDVTLSGSLYNGSGYYGQKAKQMYVTLGAGATLNGGISATETIHVNEKGEQNTHFTIDEYYYLGHVANRVFHNGDNAAEVVLEAGSVWNVTEEGLLTALTVHEGATLNGTVSVDGTVIVPEPGKTYTGKIVVAG